MMRIKDKFVTRVLTPEVSGVWGEIVWCENTFGNILITVMRKNGEPIRQVARGDGFKLKHLISLLWSCRIHHLSAWCFSCVRLEFQVRRTSRAGRWQLWISILDAAEITHGDIQEERARLPSAAKSLRERIQFVIGTFNVIPSSMRNWKGGRRAKKAQALLASASHHFI